MNMDQEQKNLWRDYNFKRVKLSDWVHEIPELVQLEQDKKWEIGKMR